MPGEAIAIPITFALSTWVLYQVSINLPPVIGTTNSSTTGNYSLHFPRSFDDLVETADVLKVYKEEHYGYVASLFMLAYLYKQTYAIPGSVFMNILGGALFGFYAFPIVCLLSATGATACYLLSKYSGRKYVLRFFPEKVKYFQAKVDTSRESLFYFLLCLRLFPMSPNWLMNMVAPIVNVPIHYFFPSVVIGLAPYNFLCVQTGVFLSSFHSIDEAFTWSKLAMLATIAMAALLPGLLINRGRSGAGGCQKKE